LSPGTFHHLVSRHESQIYTIDKDKMIVKRKRRCIGRRAGFDKQSPALIYQYRANADSGKKVVAFYDELFRKTYKLSSDKLEAPAAHIRTPQDYPATPAWFSGRYTLSAHPRT
jgi:hypothetical protein